MIQVMFVFGTRPEAIKLFPVIHAFRGISAKVETIVCTSGQHMEMLYPILGPFGIKVDHDLKVMKPNQSLSESTAKIMKGLDAILHRRKVDCVIVQGDTNTTFAGAFVGYHHLIRVAHVEAGLRTSDKTQPFPEEINRRMTDQIADWNFAPTTGARDNLLRENIPERQIYVTGNTGIDALRMMLQKNRERPTEEFSRIEAWHGEALGGGPFVLITGHRRESFGEGFREICGAIRTLAGMHRHLGWVYPVHLNPNVRRPVTEYLSGIPNVHLLEPVSYPGFVYLMEQCLAILTDSGGIQEEAPSVGKAVLVMRNTTERPEGVEAGLARLVGNRKESVVAGFTEFYEGRWRPSESPNPYGDGKAAEKIVRILSSSFP